MFNVSDFLSKYRNLTPKDSAVKEKIIRVVQHHLGVELKASSIKIQSSTAIITTSPIIKSELRLKQEIILKELQIELGDKAPVSIR